MKQNSGEIYMITNIINNKKYIGQTVSYLSSGRKYGVIRRWTSHVSYAKNNADNGIRHFCNAIRKYGKDNFKLAQEKLNPKRKNDRSKDLCSVPNCFPSPSYADQEKRSETHRKTDLCLC